jgi:hypothetical protein
MRLRSAVSTLVGQLPVAAAIGLALVAIAILRGHDWPGIVAAIGVAGAVAGLPLLSEVHGPKPPLGYRLPGYRRPVPVPTGRSSQVISGLIVMIMVLVILWLPGWLVFLVMLLTWAGLGTNLVAAYLRRRGRGRLRGELRRAVAAYAPRFVIYTGRRNDASYQLDMWVPILERLQVPYLVVLRYPEALESTQAITKAPIVVLPTGSDLDAIMVPGLSVAFYVNGIAENSTLVNYRDLTHIYLGHGDSDKELSVHPMHSMFDRVFVAGQAAIDRYRHAGVKIATSKFVIVGRPQTAGLRRAVQPIGTIRPPTVLYAPTWRGYNAQTTLSSLPVGPVPGDRPSAAAPWRRGQFPAASVQLAGHPRTVGDLSDRRTAASGPGGLRSAAPYGGRSSAELGGRGDRRLRCVDHRRRQCADRLFRDRQAVRRGAAARPVAGHRAQRSAQYGCRVPDRSRRPPPTAGRPAGVGSGRIAWQRSARGPASRGRPLLPG